jgi:4-amino-4-deoxy-L-arabinose transferase-like glycosyltransferase
LGEEFIVMPENSLSMAAVETSVSTPPARLWSRIRNSPFWIVVVAFSLRIATILLLHTYKFRTTDQNFGFGWEMGRIGESIASGNGFSNPFGGITSPTAWEPPLYPYLIAGVFKIFGIYSYASSFVLLAINSFFSALTCIPVFLIAQRCFGEKVGITSAWTWALLPYVIYWCTRWVWETSLSALLLATIFWIALTMQDRDGLKPWAQFGVLWGVAALTSPVLLSFLAISGLWALYHQRRFGKRSLSGVVLSSVVFFACISPWLIRNYLTFGKPVFIRSNFGAELRMGNGPWANGTWMYYLHPTQNKTAMRQYEDMGEISYVAERKRQALEFIKENPGQFLLISLKRFVYYWAGSMRSSNNWWLAQIKNSLFLVSSVLCFWGLARALHQRKPGAWLFLWLILLYPAVYYVVFTHARYRHPIEPEIGILAIFLISEAVRPRKGEGVAAWPEALTA